jgi:hypothetical protein
MDLDSSLPHEQVVPTDSVPDDGIDQVPPPRILEAEKDVGAIHANPVDVSVVGSVGPADGMVAVIETVAEVAAEALADAVAQGDTHEIDLILEEITELETLIASQQKKLGLLKRLQSLNPNIQRLSQHRQQPKMHQNVLQHSTPSSFGDRLKSSALLSKEKGAHELYSQSDDSLDDILEPRISVKVDYSVLDARLFFIRNVRRKRTGPAAFEYVSVIDTNGNIHIFNGTAAEVFSMPLELSAPLTGVAVDSADGKF